MHGSATTLQGRFDAQELVNEALFDDSTQLHNGPVTTKGFGLDSSKTTLSQADLTLLTALEIRAARETVKSVARLATEFNENDHMGGALGHIPVANLVNAMVNGNRPHFDFAQEHGHASAAQFSVGCVHGHTDTDTFLDGFRDGLDFPGHVVWRPGGSQICTGRLGMAIAVSAGRAISLRQQYGDKAAMFVGCGDAGINSGQATDGIQIALMHGAPLIITMDKNDLQLSGPVAAVAPTPDPRELWKNTGVKIVELESLHDVAKLYEAYQQILQENKKNPGPALIVPTGYDATLEQFLNSVGCLDAAQEFIAANKINPSETLHIPGSLMGYRDLEMMLEAIGAVNGLPWGKNHHDGGLKGRDVNKVLANPMLQLDDQQSNAVANDMPDRIVDVTTKPRPKPGTPNFEITKDMLDQGKENLPKPTDKPTNPRKGSTLAYKLLATQYGDQMFAIDPDIAASTGANGQGKLPKGHLLEVGVKEQAAMLTALGLSVGVEEGEGRLVAASTFSAFYGLGEEALAALDYYANLDGRYDGSLNVTFHVSHVGSNVGRDHASGMHLRWIDQGLRYLDRLNGFFAASDANSAFLSVMKAAEQNGAHMVCVPRDVVDISDDPQGLLTKQDNPEEPFFDVADLDSFKPIMQYRKYDGAKSAIISIGAPGVIAGKAAEQLTQDEVPTDVYVVNSLPLDGEELNSILANYPNGVVTVEDNEVGSPKRGFGGFAGFAKSFWPAGIPMAPCGITNSSIFPSGDQKDMWEHFGITVEGISGTVKALAAEAK